MSLYLLAKILAVLLSGLIAGLFYGFQCAVNKGLGSLGDKEYLLGFQGINKAILNPLFFAGFMGTLVVLPISCWLSYHQADLPAFYLLLAATVLYLVGGFGLTVGGNVPLNNALDRFNIHAASPKGLSAQRKHFEGPWNRYHSIRTLACFLCFLLTILSLIEFG